MDLYCLVWESTKQYEVLIRVRWNLAFQHGRTVQTPRATVLLKVMHSMSIELPFENSQIPEITFICNFHLFERFKASKD